MDSLRRQFSRNFRSFAAVCLLAVSVAAMANPNSGNNTPSPSNPEDSSRPLKVKVTPEYPELARQMNMKGSVRLELLVAADGHVKSTRVLGGNPVLVRAAEDAARKWRYAPAAAESFVVVRFDFDPSMAVK